MENAYRVIVGTMFDYVYVTYDRDMAAEWCRFSIDQLWRLRDFVLLTKDKVISENAEGPLRFSGGCISPEPLDQYRPNMKCKNYFP